MKSRLASLALSFLFALGFTLLDTDNASAQAATKLPTPPGSTPPPPPSTLNTRLAADTTVAGVRCAGFFVAEADQGNTDLNGDTDVSDQVLHVWDAKTGMTVNTGIAGVSGAPL